jgi:hypothetical protein
VAALVLPEGALVKAGDSAFAWRLKERSSLQKVPVKLGPRDARSGQYEKDEVTATAPIWNVGSDVAVSYVDAPGNAATVCAAGASNCELPLTLSHLNSWKHYRYKVFDTVIPLRNILWSLGT